MNFPAQVSHVLWEMYYWPGGNVIGNLIASAITSIALYVKVHFKLKKQNKEQLTKLDTQHAATMQQSADQHAERMTELRKLGKIVSSPNVSSDIAGKPPVS